MPLDFQSVSIALGTGLDTKTDPKQVVPSKVIILQDSIFTNAKRWTKRNGYDALTTNIVGGGTISSPTMVESFKQELVCAATHSNGSGQRLFSYSTTANAWVDVGKYISISVSKEATTSPTVLGNNSNTNANGVYNSSSVIIGQYELIAYDAGYSAGTTGTYISVVDLTTNTKIIDGFHVGNSVGWSKAVSFNGTTFGIVYVTGSSPGHLAASTISVSASGVTVNAEFIFDNCLADTSGSPVYKYAYDAITVNYTTAGHLVGLAVSTPDATAHTITINLLYVSGTTIASAASVSVAAGTGTLLPVTIVQDVTSLEYWLYWALGTSGMNYAIYDKDLSAVLAVTSVPTTSGTIRQIVSTGGTSNQTVYFSRYTLPSGSLHAPFPRLSTSAVSRSGTGLITIVSALSCDLYSKILDLGATRYLAVVTVSANNPIGLLVDLSTGFVAVAKFLVGQAEGSYLNFVGTASTVPSTGDVMRYPGFLNNFYSPSSNKYTLCCGYTTPGGLTFSVPPTSPSATTTYYSEMTDTINMGVCTITFDFNDPDSYQALIQEDLLVMNGGIISQYDGTSTCELGFTVDPDGITAVPSSTGGSISSPSGTSSWIYYVTYSWVDAQGNLNESAPSTGIVAYLAGSTNSVAITVIRPSFTQKITTNSPVIINIYRTQADGQIAYRVNQSVISGVGISLTFTDTLADSAIINNPTLYTQGGAILENIAPPSSMILWQNHSRLWCIDSENPETLIEYSKTASRGTGIEFSRGQLEIVIDSKGGAISGASPMDEKTIILKKDSIGYFYGDGANDAGTGSSITSFQFIPSDVGCTNSKSVILYPNGVIFRSSKGIYLVNRGINVVYFGMDVQKYNSQNITSAKIISDKNQIRFLTSSGLSLLYDYFFNQWSAFSNHLGVSGTNWNGVYVYVRPSGEIYKENTTTFLDAGVGYAMSGTTAWIKAFSAQNFERVRLLEVLGSYSGQSGHGVQISTAYDFNDTPLTSTVPYLFSGSHSSFQTRAFMSKQKCDAISITLTEIITGASGEYIDLTDLAMEIGVKRGLNKLPAAQSVG